MKKLNDTSRKIIMKRLGMKNSNEVFKREFKATDSKSETREKIHTYKRLIRGSVRLSSGRYYTAEEYAQRVKKAKETPLP